jgi:hypothetical protein
MFIIPCKYSNQSPIQKCVESIINFHPDEKITIVDSNSENKAYFNKFRDVKNVKILDCGNTNYIIGALWKAYRAFPDEKYYILIHDSIILKKPIKKEVLTDNNFYSFMYFPEYVQYDGTKEYGFYKKVFSKIEYKIPKQRESINGCFGVMCIIKNNLIKIFDKKGLVDNALANNKLECNMCERLIGICAEQEGFSPKEYNLEGNFLEKIEDLKLGKLKAFEKFFFNRE